MEYLSFPARLLAPYNDIQEYGEGHLGAGGDAVDFLSDFVPLIPLGSLAAIEWTYAGRTIATYEGKVYLSTPSLLRLVEVDESLVVRARGIFATNTRLPGQVREGAEAPPARALPRPVEILYLSVGMVKLHTSFQPPVGHRLLLDVEVDFLTLHGLCLRVRQAVPLRRDENLLLCEVERSGNDNYIALSTYSNRLDRIGRAED